MLGEGTKICFVYLLGKEVREEPSLSQALR